MTAMMQKVAFIQQHQSENTMFQREAKTRIRTIVIYDETDEKFHLLFSVKRLNKHTRIHTHTHTHHTHTHTLIENLH